MPLWCVNCNKRECVCGQIIAVEEYDEDVQKTVLTPPQKKRMVELGWMLLEHKYRYYEWGRNSISDYEYDKLEREYKSLGGIPSVGWPASRPSAMLVRDKLEGINRPKKPEGFDEWYEERKRIQAKIDQDWSDQHRSEDTAPDC